MSPSSSTSSGARTWSSPPSAACPPPPLFALVPHFGLFRPLRGRGTVAISLITVGLGLVIRDAIYLIAGSQVRVYGISQSEVLTFGFVRFSPGQSVAIAVALVVAPLTRCSWRARAWANRCAPSPTIATWPPSRGSTSSAWRLRLDHGRGLAGLGGVMLAADSGTVRAEPGRCTAVPDLHHGRAGRHRQRLRRAHGWPALGLAMELSTWEGFLGGVEPKYKPVLAFLVLILLLLYRPQGLFGRARGCDAGLP